MSRLTEKRLNIKTQIKCSNGILNEMHMLPIEIWNGSNSRWVQGLLKGILKSFDNMDETFHSKNVLYLINFNLISVD